MHKRRLVFYLSLFTYPKIQLVDIATIESKGMRPV